MMFSTVHTMTVSFPYHTQCQMLVDSTQCSKITKVHKVTASFPHHTECLLTVHTMTTSFPHHTECQILVHTMTASFPHHTECLLTNHTMTASFPQYIKNYDVSMFSTVHTVQKFFHSALITTMSLSFQHHTQDLQLQYL